MGREMVMQYEAHRNAPAMILGHKDGIPIVACYRVKDQVTFLCPFCGKRHWHGAGKDRSKSGDGHRVAHCLIKRSDNRRGYILKEMDGFQFSGYLPKKYRGEILNDRHFAVLTEKDWLQLPEEFYE